MTALGHAGKGHEYVPLASIWPLVARLTLINGWFAGTRMNGIPLGSG